MLMDCLIETRKIYSLRLSYYNIWRIVFITFTNPAHAGSDDFWRKADSRRTAVQLYNETSDLIDGTIHN